MFSSTRSGPKTLQHWDVELKDLQTSRLRHAILRLGDRIAADTRQRSDLAPYLLEAFQHAVFQLLMLGDEKDLMALDTWLDEETALSAMRRSWQGALHEFAGRRCADCCDLKCDLEAELAT